MLRTAPLTLLAAALLAVPVAGCGVRVDDGPTRTESRTVGAFDRIVLEGDADVTVRLGRAHRVTVRAGEEVIDDVEVRVVDGTLVVDRRDGDDWTIGGDGVDVDVRAPAIGAVAVRGAGDVALEEVDGAVLEVDVDGSGDVSAAGRVGRLSATVDGSGDVDLADLAARDAAVLVEGSGDVSVRADGRLEATVRGSGDVDYRGAATVEQVVDGSGDVSRAD